MSRLIRSATGSDLAAVRFLGFSTWPQTYGPFAGPAYVVSGLDEYWGAETVARAIRAGNVSIAVDDDGDVVGMSEAEVVDGDLVMWKLYVLPGRQGSGIGRALLDAVKRRAASEGRPLLTEYVAGNERAGAFYRSQGFVDLDGAASPLSSVWLRYEA